MGKILNFNKAPVEKEAGRPNDEANKKKAEPGAKTDNIIGLKETPEIMLKKLSKRTKKLQDEIDLLLFEFQGDYDKEIFLEKCEQFKLSKIDPVLQDIASGWKLVGYDPECVDELDDLQEEIKEMLETITELAWAVRYGEDFEAGS
jgi:hypothetical protein